MIQQINTCDSGLHAVDHANTRFSSNNISNGVGNIVCARHTFVRKTCAVDLAKGEKYDLYPTTTNLRSLTFAGIVAWIMRCFRL
jgi:hypothetical protein